MYISDERKLLQLYLINKYILFSIYHFIFISVEVLRSFRVFSPRKQKYKKNLVTSRL